LKALTDEVKQSEERVKSIGPSDIERKKFEKQLEKLEHLAQQKCSIAAKKREELEILKNQLLNFGSDRLATVRTRLDIMEKKIKDTNDELTKLEVSLKTVTRNQQKSMDKLKNMENEAELLKTKLMNIDNKLKQLEDDARACMLDYQNIQNEVSYFNVVTFNVVTMATKNVYVYVCVMLLTLQLTLKSIIEEFQ
ncbi:uncharacterized protein DC041_0008504, partial [Schistosoma bovis]